MALRPGIDIPIVQWCEPTPDSQHHGAAIAWDMGDYIYWLRGNNSNLFRRYRVRGDTHQYLSSAPWSAYQGAHLIYDPSRGYFFAIQGNAGTGFAYYNPANGGWTSLAALPVAANYGSWICHTCSTLKSGANDDYVYYAPANGSTSFYRYSISGNSFTSLASAPAALSNGSIGVWVYNYNPDKIYVIRGGGTTTIYVYSISGNSWTTLTYTPAAFSFSTGTHAVYDPDTNRIYMCLSEGYRYIYYLDLSTNKMEAYARLPLPYYREARRLEIVRVNGRKFLYVFRGYEGAPYAVWRIPMFW
ncbi:MAG: hypothetical protein QXT64_07965 [Desulfurococcaceae archaeon]